MNINEIMQSILQVPSQASESGISFPTVFNMFLVYLAFLWIAFCIWVFFDAKRRYKNIVVVIVLTLFVFILNFPALILYLVIRPEDDHVGGYHGIAGGVDVPIVKFIGEEGEVKMALNLNISSALYKQADMSLNLGVSGDREDMSIVAGESLSTQDEKKNKAAKKIMSKDRSEWLSSKIAAWRGKMPFKKNTKKNLDISSREPKKTESNEQKSQIEEKDDIVADVEQ